MLNTIRLHLWHEIFCLSFACTNSLVFEKRRFFVNNNHILTRLVVLGTFLDSADVSSNSTFKLSEWRSCTISFELQMPQSLLPLTSLAPFSEGLTKIY